jgi:diguanylate cyclase (GGDEF)-like protein
VTGSAELGLVGLGLVLAGVAGWRLGRRRAPSGGDRGAVPTDHEHLLDLLRRAHRAVVALRLDSDGTVIASKHPRGIKASLVERGVATARLALANAREQRLREAPGTVAVTHEGLAVALVFDGPIGEDAAERVAEDAWRLAAGLAGAGRLDDRDSQPARFGGESWLVVPETIEAASHALCEKVRRHTGRPTGLVLRNETTGALHITLVSSGGDPRLQGTSVLPESAVARAVEGDTPVAGMSVEELLGHPRPDRRRADLQGLAFPMVDGRAPVGALVVFGPPSGLSPELREEVSHMVLAATPRIGHLQAIHVREARARTDELTGLVNRHGLKAAMSLWTGEAAALLIVDLDHFKRVNDTLGHVAGDAALQHLASLLRSALRERDVAARIGGEEFALWLPETPLRSAVEVAERVRAAVEKTPAFWSGKAIPLTCSIGVAAIPEIATNRDNLYPAADAALYRAKQAGRNRVTVSGSDDPRTAGTRGTR